MYLSNEQKKAFHERGLIVVRRFFNAKQMSEVSVWLDQLCEPSPVACKEAKYYERSPLTRDGILVRAENILGDHNPVLTQCLLSPKTLGCLTELLGEPPVLFKDKVNYKLPGCRSDKLHQDQAAGWNAYASFYVSMCIAVDRNTVENAAMSFMTSGNYQKRLMSPEWQPLCEDDPPYTPEDEYTLMEAEPGDVIFFDSYVPHGSPPNTSDKSRRNIFVTFNKRSDGDKRADYYRDKWAVYPPNDAAELRSRDSFRV